MGGAGSVASRAGQSPPRIVSGRLCGCGLDPEAEIAFRLSHTSKALFEGVCEGLWGGLESQCLCASFSRRESWTAIDLSQSRWGRLSRLRFFRPPRHASVDAPFPCPGPTTTHAAQPERVVTDSSGSAQGNFCAPPFVTPWRPRLCQAPWCGPRRAACIPCGHGQVESSSGSNSPRSSVPCRPAQSHQSLS